jgi:hypothetical protein
VGLGATPLQAKKPREVTNICSFPSHGEGSLVIGEDSVLIMGFLNSTQLRREKKYNEVLKKDVYRGDSC